MSTIAERFLLLRGQAKQGDFAQALNINPNTLRNYENGRVFPNQEILERICVKFSVSPEWLLLGRGPMRLGDPVPTTPEGAPQEPPQTQESACAACAELKKELDMERRERRELTAENRQLWKENGELREKCARLEERQYRVGIKHGDAEALGGAG